jgi:hypothetical protein
MLSSWLMTGLVVNVAMRRQATLARPSFEFDAVPYDPDNPHLPQKIMPRVGRAEDPAIAARSGGVVGRSRSARSA